MKPIPENADDDERGKATKGNILTMAKIAAPGIFFTLSRIGYNEYKLTWTNGPTCEELSKAADFDLFIGYVDYHDVYADYWDTKDRKYNAFAKRYGLAKNSIKFNRKVADTDRNRKKSAAGEKSSSESIVSEGNGIEVSRNEDRNGIEIRFNSIPSADIRSDMKANGWRWSKFSKCWYHRATDEAMAYAQGLVDKMVHDAA